MKKILVSEASNCTGCRICEVICALEKGEGCNPEKSRIRIIKSEEAGVDVPAICHHCEDPLCQKACPVEAIVKDPETGAVIVIADTCIGCNECVMVCPYGAISMDNDRGIVMKCDLCQGNPQCVEFCPKGALLYERGDVIHARVRESKHERIVEAVAKSLVI